jgi:hypothetical protein
MWRRIVWEVVINGSSQHIVSICRLEDGGSRYPRNVSTFYQTTRRSTEFSNICVSKIPLKGRVIAQAVIRRLLTAAARVRARVKSCGICGGQSGTGESFLRVFRFPLPIRIPPIAPQSSSSSYICRGWYNRPNSGSSTKWTHPKEKNSTYDPRGGGDEYLHRSPASRRRQRKGTQCLGV